MDLGGDALSIAAEQHEHLTDSTAIYEQVLTYMLDRFRSWFDEQNISIQAYLSVVAKPLSNPLDIQLRVLAVEEFSQLPEAAALAAANKRVSNILAKQANDRQTVAVQPSLLLEPAERALAEQLMDLEKRVGPLVSSRQYTEALKQLAALQTSVDQFFDQVMVMVEDEAVRNNRLSLLMQLRNLFLEIADISLLVAV